MKLDRRHFLRHAGLAAGALLVRPRLVWADTAPLSEAARAALSESPLVYISPRARPLAPRATGESCA